MKPRYLLIGAAAVLGVALSTGSAYALSEGEIDHLHHLCVSGDRDACAHRDAAIHDREHESEWRHHHPEWYR